VVGVERNLIELHRRHMIRILHDYRIVPGIESKILNQKKE
jgi:hypothetical protein